MRILRLKQYTFATAMNHRFKNFVSHHSSWNYLIAVVIGRLRHILFHHPIQTLFRRFFRSIFVNHQFPYSSCNFFVVLFSMLPRPLSIIICIYTSFFCIQYRSFFLFCFWSSLFLWTCYIDRLQGDDLMFFLLHFHRRISHILSHLHQSKVLFST